MKTTIRLSLALAAMLTASTAVSFAQAGAGVYKANCQSCHGANGTPSPGMAKMMSIKGASEYKTSADEQFASVKNGKNKMKPFAGKLSDAEIKDAVAYFHTLK